MKRVFAFVLAMVMIVTASPLAFASDFSDNEEFYFICYSETGEILYYNMPCDLAGNTRSGDWTYLKSVFLDDEPIYNYDCGYHPDTTIWRKVSSYSFSTSSTVGVAVSVQWGSKTFNGTIGISASTANSFSYTITADQTQFSKIHVYCDYLCEFYRGEVRDINTDELYSTFTYATFTKTAEDFRVEYQT